jgi:hypothetical protein
MKAPIHYYNGGVYSAAQPSKCYTLCGLTFISAAPKMFNGGHGWETQVTCKKCLSKLRKVN